MVLTHALNGKRYGFINRTVLLQLCRQKWEALVPASVAHWIERYGLEEVLQWRFTILSFNYVQLPESPMDYADYLDMYCTTYRILKELDDG